jgi:peptide/nickel transport system substrate-binding protein
VPIGTGAYKWESTVYGQYHSIVANENYHGSRMSVEGMNRPYLDRVVYKLIKDETSAMLALATGDVHVLNEYIGGRIEPDQLSLLVDDPRYDVRAKASSVVVRCVFNNRSEAKAIHPWLADKNVKMALAHAIDRQAIIDDVLLGLTQTSWGPVSNLFASWYNNALLDMEPEYNPTLAEQLLDDAGWPEDGNGVRFSFEFAVLQEGLIPKVAEVIKDFWRQIGVEATLYIPDRATFIEVIEYGPNGLDDYAIGMCTGGTGPEIPSNMQNNYHSDFRPHLRKGENFYWYENAAADELIDLAFVEPDQEVAMQYINEFQEIVAEDMPCIWLFRNYGIEVNSVDFGGFELAYPDSHTTDYRNIWWDGGEPLIPEDGDGDGDGTDGDGDGDDYEGREGAVFPWLEVGIAVIVIIIIAVVGLAFFGRKKQ